MHPGHWAHPPHLSVPLSCHSPDFLLSMNLTVLTISKHAVVLVKFPLLEFVFLILLGEGHGSYLPCKSLCAKAHVSMTWLSGWGAVSPHNVTLPFSTPCSWMTVTWDPDLRCTESSSIWSMTELLLGYLKFFCMETVYPVFIFHRFRIANICHIFWLLTWGYHILPHDFASFHHWEHFHMGPVPFKTLHHCANFGFVWAFIAHFGWLWCVLEGKPLEAPLVYYVQS